MDKSHLASQSWQARLLAMMEDRAEADALALVEDAPHGRVGDAGHQAIEEDAIYKAQQSHRRLVKDIERLAAVALPVLDAFTDAIVREPQGDDEAIFWDFLLAAVEDARRAKRRPAPVIDLAAHISELGDAINRSLAGSIPERVEIEPMPKEG